MSEPVSAPVIAEWFYARQRQKIGPVTLDQLRSLLQSGEVAPGDMVLRQGTTQWVPASNVGELANGVGVTIEPTLAQEDGAVQREGQNTQTDKPPETRAFAAPDSLHTVDYSGSTMSFAASSLAGHPTIPGYELLGVLGKGGMGVVYKARQIALNRLVALKMIRSGAGADEQELARFFVEAEAVARLRHDGIVQIYEVGRSGECPFFSLEYVDGGTLASQIAGTPQPALEAARVTEALARAMTVAHEAGIIHRDLKPANVLLQGAKPQAAVPKITDFGLAKRLGQDDGLTHTGAVMGTPSYMAPEQARGETHALGPLVDVWALGAILYEMLTGRPPFKGASVGETMHLVLTSEPVPPRQLAPGVPRDLETICLRCLQKEPGKRYGSAAALAEDLRRFQSGEPILARPVGRLERSWRWCRRNPALAASLLLLVLSLVGGVTGIVVKGLEAIENAKIAKENEEYAEKQKTDAITQKEKAETSERKQRKFVYASLMAQIPEAWKRGDIALVHRILETFIPDAEKKDEPDLRGVEWHYYWDKSHGSRLTLHGHASALRIVRFSPNGKYIASGSFDPVVRLWEAATGKELHGFSVDSAVDSLAFSPDGTLLLTASMNGGVRVWDLEKRAKIEDIFTPRHAYCVGFSPNGQVILIGGNDGKFHFVDRGTRKPLGMIALDKGDNPRSFTFTPDGKRLLVGGSQGKIYVSMPLTDAMSLPTRWDSRFALHGSEAAIEILEFAPRGQALLSSAKDGDIKHSHFSSEFKNLTNTQFLAESSPQTLPVTWGPDGHSLCFANSTDPKIVLWNIETGKMAAEFRGHISVVKTLAFSPDGKLLASGGDDRSLKIWDVKSTLAQATHPAAGRDARIHDVAFSPDGARLASASEDGTLRLWNAETGKEERVIHRSGLPQYAIVFTSDGKRLYAGGGDRRVRLWNPSTGVPVQSWDMDAEVTCLSLAPDGTALALGTHDGGVRLLDPHTGEEWFRCRPHRERVNALVFHPNSKEFASGSQDLSVARIEAGTGEIIQTLWPHFQRITALLYAGDPPRLHSAATDGSLHAWSNLKKNYIRLSTQGAEYGRGTLGGDGRTLIFPESNNEAGLLTCWTPDAVENKQVPEYYRHGRAGLTCLSQSADGRRIVTGANDGTLALWDAHSKRVLQSWPGHARALSSAVCSPDGRWLASGGDDRIVRLQTVETRATRQLVGHTQPIHALAFTTDSRTLASCSLDRSIRLWDPATGDCRSTWTPPKLEPHCLAWSSDGKTLAVGGNGDNGFGEIVLLDGTTGEVRTRLAGNRWMVRGLAWSPDGTVLASVNGDSYALPGEVALWDVAEKKLRFIDRGTDTKGYRALAWSPDGRVLATAGVDGITRIWEVANEFERLTLQRQLAGPTTKSLACLAFSPDGNTLAVGGHLPHVSFWQPKLGLPLGHLEQPAPLRALAFHPIKRTLYLVLNDGQLVSQSIVSEEKVARESTSQAVALDLEREAEQLLIRTRTRQSDLVHVDQDADTESKRSSLVEDARRLQQWIDEDPTQTRLHNDYLELQERRERFASTVEGKKKVNAEAIAWTDARLKIAPGDANLLHWRARLLHLTEHWLNTGKEEDIALMDAMLSAARMMERLRGATLDQTTGATYRRLAATLYFDYDSLRGTRTKDAYYHRAAALLDEQRLGPTATLEDLVELERCRYFIVFSHKISIRQKTAEDRRREIVDRREHLHRARQLARLQRDDHWRQTRLIAAMDDLSTALEGERPEEARALFLEALANVEDLYKRRLNLRATVPLLHEHFHKECLRCEKQGNFRDAGYYQAYRAFVASRDLAQKVADREKLAEELTRDAFRLFDRAAEQGKLSERFFNSAEYLRPLRTRPEFAGLLEKIKQKQRP